MTQNNTTELTEVLTRIKFVKNGFMVAQLENGVIVSGTAPESLDSFRPGVRYKFLGEWSNYQGKEQFKFRDFFPVEQLSGVSIMQFLQTFDGVGSVVAEKLFVAYQSDVFEALKTNHIQVADKIKGLSAKVAESLSKELIKLAETVEARTLLHDVFRSRGVPKATIERCIHRWGSKAYHEVKSNAYCLINLPGIGFKTCDSIYLDLGGDPENIERQIYCIEDFVASQEDTWVPVALCESHLKQVISGCEVDISKATQEGTRRKVLAWDADSFMVANHRDAQAEKRIAEAISLSGTRLGWDTDSTELTDSQLAAANIAMSQTIGCLIGTPGTGKTYTSSIILKEALQSFSDDEIAVMAPTGNAAKRIRQAMFGNGVEIEATTIHSAIYNNVDGEWVLKSLDKKFIVVDEASMIDAILFADLLKAVGPNCKILFVGDPNQLPPVGKGAPFRDLIDSGIVPVGELTEVKRNDGTIIEVCTAIREGKWKPKKHGSLTPIDLDSGFNFKHVETRDHRHTLKEITKRLVNATAVGIDPTWDCQVICLLNEKGELSRIKLNEFIQGLLNPAEPTKREYKSGSRLFRIGDKVVNLRNQDISGQRVVNGEVGKIKDIYESREGNQITTEIAVDFENTKGESIYRVGTDAFQYLALAYVVTIHKAQGGQYPYVFYVSDNYSGARQVGSRESIYTVISRAEKAMITLGSVATIRRDASKQALKRRKTLLKELLVKPRTYFPSGV